MDSPDIDFSLAEWKQKTKSVQVYIQKPVQTLQLLASYHFYYNVSINFKSVFKIKYFFGNQIEATK